MAMRTRTRGPSAGATRALPDALLGRVYGGRYHVDAFLGAGGMGRVYRVHDLLDKVDRPDSSSTPSWRS